jgi:hypothetical protein
MQEYHDYVRLILGGPGLAGLVEDPTRAQLAGVPDLQMEVFDHIVADFDCQSLNTLPLGRGNSHISDATPEFMSKYLLMLVVLLAAADSDDRRRRFFHLASSVLGNPNTPIVGSDANIRLLVTTLLASTDSQIQNWLRFAPGEGRHGRKVKSAAQYITHVSPRCIVPEPIGGPDTLKNSIFGMGPKTARLYYRWMCQPPPDLGLWPHALNGLEIPVDTRILETCRESLSVVPGANTPHWQNAFTEPINAHTFAYVTQYVQNILGFGANFMQVDYPFWLLARRRNGQLVPGCYSRIQSLGDACPLARFQLPRCCKSRCAFLNTPGFQVSNHAGRA